MLAKLIMFAIIIAIIYFFIYPKFKSKNKYQNKNEEIENFVECKNCKTFINIKNTTITNGKYICNNCFKER